MNKLERRSKIFAGSTEWPGNFNNTYGARTFHFLQFFIVSPTYSTCRGSTVLIPIIMSRWFSITCHDIYVIRGRRVGTAPFCGVIVAKHCYTTTHLNDIRFTARSEYVRFVSALYRIWKKCHRTTLLLHHDVMIVCNRVIFLIWYLINAIASQNFGWIRFA